jgi:GT2 family glycosyltransferase
MLGIIIINYNSYEKTIDCISSVKNTYKGDYHIYLLDNASTNESQKVLNELFGEDKRITLILSNQNHGYARGNNLCLKMAKDDGCEYAIISNNDIVYKEGAVSLLLETVKQDNVLLVGPKVIKPSGEEQFTIKWSKPGYWEYIKFETYLRNFFKKQDKRRRVLPDKTTEVYWIAGCAFIVNMQLFEQIGFFDDYTFLYFEEYILSEKAKSAGFKLLFCPEAEVLHFHGYSMGGALNVVTRSSNWRSESYFIKNYCKWNYIKRYILWQIRVMEIRFNARKSGKYTEIVRDYKKGRKYL